MKLPLLLGVLLFNFLAHSQSYYAVSVKGKVLADGVVVTPKDKISADAQLVFSSEKDELKIMSTKHGFYVLKPEGAKKKSDTEFLIALQEAIIPSQQYKATSFRGEKMENCDHPFRSLLELRSFFRGNVLLLDTAFFSIDTNEFPQDSRRYFELVQITAADTLISPLPYKGAKLLLPSEYIAFNSLEDPRLSLYYVDEPDKSRTLIGHFNGKKEDQAKVIADLQIIYQLNPVSGPTFLCQYGLPYVSTYGRVNAEQVRALLEKGAIGQKP